MTKNRNILNTDNININSNNNISLNDYKFVKTKREGSIIYIYMVHKQNISDIIKINVFDI
jgi:hypothetical protein